MGLMGHEEVRFPTTLPDTEQIQQELEKLTGLAIEQAEVGPCWALEATAEPGVTMRVLLYQMEGLYFISYNAGHKYNPYLFYSLLHVLAGLGGQPEEEPLLWQGKSWEAFKRGWNPVYIISPKM